MFRCRAKEDEEEVCGSGTSEDVVKGFSEEVKGGVMQLAFV